MVMAPNFENLVTERMTIGSIPEINSELFGELIYDKEVGCM